MKKITAAILLAMMLLALTACGAADTTIGSAMVVSMSGSSATAEKAGSTQADVTSCTVELDKDGKIVSVSWDVVQCKGTATATGEVTVAQSVTSKKDLKEGYNMKGASPIGKEWYEQIAALEEYAVGKTVSEVCGMSTKTVGSHTEVPAIDELTSSCTIGVGDFFKALTAAAANAK